MKTGTAETMKFLVLKNQLRLPKFQVIGILEGLWYLASTSAQDGAIGKFSNEEIAAWIEYDGDPEQLIDILVARKFLDRCPVHRLIIHDWKDHCPQYVKGILERHKKPFATIQEAPIGSSYRKLLEEAPQSSLPPILFYSNQVKPNLTKANQCAASAADLTEKPPLIESTDPSPEGKPAKRNPDAEIVIPLSLAAEPFPTAWYEWISVRKQNRWSTREPCLRRQIEALEPLGPQLASDCLRMSIRNGWQGIFPEKMKPGATQHGRPKQGAGVIYDPDAAAKDPDHGKM